MRLISIAAGLAVAFCAATGAFAEDGYKRYAFTKYESGAGGIALPIGNTTVSQSSVLCGYELACKIVTTATVEVNSGGSPWSICVLIDGQPAIPACTAQPYVAGQPTTGTIISIGKFPTGNPSRHTVAVQVQLASPGALGGWGIIYTGAE